MSFNGQVESGPPVLIPTTTPRTVGADITQWPWPRILSTQFHVLLFVKQSSGALYLFEMALTTFDTWEGYVVGNLGVADDITMVDVADFGPFYVVCCSGPSHLSTWIRDTTLEQESANRDLVGVSFLSEVAQPLMKTVCNNGGQLLGGNVREWQELGTNGVVWSEVGNFNFDPIQAPTAGFRQLVDSRGSGDPCIIHRVLPLHEGVIAYTSHGNVALFDSLEGTTFTYGLVPLKGLGVASGNHIAGNEYLHGFIDLNNEFWLLENASFRTLSQTGGKLVNRGYKAQIEDLLKAGTELIVSFVPLNNRFYISNGLTTLVVNDFGACTVHQAVSGVLVGWNKQLYGTFRDFGDREARIVIDGNDFGTQGLKTLESVQCGLSYLDSAQVSASVQTKYKQRSDFVQGLWKPFNDRGEASIKSTAIEHRISVRFSEYGGSSIYSLNANVKFPDARFRRGLATSNSGQEVGPG